MTADSDQAELLAASAAIKEGRIAEAKQHMDALCARLPRVPEFRLIMAQLLAASGHTDEAVSYLKEAARIFPNHAALHSTLIHYQGKAQPAVKSVVEYLEQNPKRGNLLEAHPFAHGQNATRRVWHMQSPLVHGPSGYLLSAEGEVFDQNGLSRPVADFISNVGVDSTEIQQAAQISGEWLILYGPWAEGFYHWMMEWIPRLLLAEAHGFKGQIALQNPNKFQLDTLRLLGISENRLHIVDHVLWRPECAWLTEPIYGSHLESFPALLNEVRERLLRQVRPNTSYGDRLYIPRRNPHRPRRIVNEAALVALLKRYDVRECLMDDLAVSDQIAIAMQAKILVGPHGAGMLHSLFMPKRSLIIELFPPNYVNPCLMPALKLLKHGYHMIISPWEGGEYKYGQDILAYLGAVECALEHQLGAESD
jgi:Glycosyltransferase 61/Tetratricopeptide repeat